MRVLSQLRGRFSPRSRLVRRYLRGAGIEIGALHAPTRLPRGVRAQYVDHLAGADLAAHYPELDSRAFVGVDLVDDAETLARLPDASQDFVIASHVLEHCEDPIGAFENWLRVLRVGGVAFLAVPSKEQTFDRPRPVTTWDHLQRDHREGAERSRRDHYLEWATLVAGESGEAARQCAAALEANRYSIHFHVWDLPAFRRFVEGCRKTFHRRFEVLELIQHEAEFLLAARRLGHT